MLTIIFLSTVCATLLVFYLYSECVRPEKYPVGPSWLPLIGNILEFKKFAKTYDGLHLAFWGLAKKYNSEVVAVKLGQERTVCVHSYPLVKHGFISEDYEGRPDNFFWRLRALGTRFGITSTDGELWKEQRAFLLSHLKALGYGKTKMEEMIKEEITDITDMIEKNPEDFELDASLSPAILNILWILTSGTGSKQDKQVLYLLELLDKRSRFFDISGGILNYLPWVRYLAPEKTGYNLIMKINEEIKTFIMRAIKEHKETWTEGCCDDVIYAYLSEIKKREGAPSNFTDEQLIMVCLDIFLAGATITSNTINYTFYAMLLYPKIQEKVYKCLEEAFRDNEDISYSKRTRVPYVQAVLLECQRVFPVFPFSGPRRVLKTTELDNYIIPENTTVLLNIHSVHHDKSYWKDPENFRPERFLDQDGKLIPQERLITFGLGKRKCLGDTLAKVCIFLFFARILRKYKLELKDGHPLLTGKPVSGIILSAEKYRAKFIPRF